MASDAMKLGLVLYATDKMSRVVDLAVKNSAAKLKSFNNSIKSVNEASNKMFVAGGVMAAGIYKTVLAAEDGAASEKKLQNVFRTMWGNNGEANKAGKQISDYAEKLALQIGVEDDLIRTTQAKLATFSKVSNQMGITSGVFDRATKAAYDMASVGFGEASQNAVLLGKALQSPLVGIKALKKQGTLNDDDILSIKNIYKTQGHLAAQKAILEKVERQVKGTGMATVKATDIMKVGFGQIVEEIGGVFLPSVDEAKKGVIDFIEPVKNWIKENKGLIKTVAKIAVAMVAVAAAMRVATFIIKAVRVATAAYAMILKLNQTYLIAFRIQYYSMIAVQKAGIIATKAITAVQWLWNAAMTANPIGLIIAGIAALVAIVVVCWKKFAGFRAVIKTVWETVKGFGTIIKTYIIDRVKGIIAGLGSLGRAIGLLFKGKFKEAGQEAVKGVRALSGYDAKMKAMQSSKALLMGTKNTYNNIYAKEKLAQNMATTNNAKTSGGGGAMNVTSSPTVVINGNADKNTIDQSLKEHEKRIIEIVEKNNSNNKRLAY